jgi:hypothetical protein
MEETWLFEQNIYNKGTTSNFKNRIPWYGIYGVERGGL